MAISDTSTNASAAHTTTRRDLLKAAPIVAAGIAIPAAALTPTADRTQWEAAFAAHQKAIAEDAAYEPVHRRVYEAWEAGRPSMDTIHWQAFPFQNRNHVARVMDLEKAWESFLVGAGVMWTARDTRAGKALYRAALDSVKAFREAEERHRSTSGMDAADDRWMALGNAVSETQDALMQMPAPDLAALRWKLAKLRDDDGSVIAWAPDYIAQTFADMERLLPKGA